MNESNKINIIREQGEFFDAVPLKDEEEKIIKEQMMNEDSKKPNNPEQ